ncbi:MAG: DUF2292 domain-containing protein [Verrucomicrobia bacterium]|nr:DUF2292 domain-containing protein [Verrucomicrobiota bacterium]
MPPSSNPDSAPSDAASPAWLQWLLPKLQELRFGSVVLVVHDGRVTQIEFTERTRLG